MSVFVRSMWITKKKIVSNYCFKQCSNEYCLQNIVLYLLLFKIIEIFHQLVNIIMERFTYIIMYGNLAVTNLRNRWQVPEFISCHLLCSQGTLFADHNLVKLSMTNFNKYLHFWFIICAHTKYSASFNIFQAKQNLFSSFSSTS